MSSSVHKSGGTRIGRWMLMWCGSSLMLSRPLSWLLEFVSGASSGCGRNPLAALRRGPDAGLRDRTRPGQPTSAIGLILSSHGLLNSRFSRVQGRTSLCSAARLITQPVSRSRFRVVPRGTCLRFKTRACKSQDPLSYALRTASSFHDQTVTPSSTLMFISKPTVLVSHETVAV